MASIKIMFFIFHLSKHHTCEWLFCLKLNFRLTFSKMQISPIKERISLHDMHCILNFFRYICFSIGIFFIIYHNIIFLENNTGCCFVLENFRIPIYPIYATNVQPSHSQISANLISQTRHVCYSNQSNNKRLIDRV